MAYTKKVWKDAPDTSTPINAANLNHMEDGIATADVNAQNALDRLDDVDDEITQINSDLNDNYHLWYLTNFKKNGSQSTITGNISHNNGITMTKIDIVWKNPFDISDTDLLILTFEDNFPIFPTRLLATVGSVITYAYYNNSDHGLYIRVPNRLYQANNDVIISGYMGLST